MTLPLVTLVLPYFNEADYIEATLDSLSAQTDRRFRLVLVDNASSDNSAALARQACGAMPDIAAEFIEASDPGKIFALRKGIAAAGTPFVATLDADTIYPPDYVARIIREFGKSRDVVAVLAFGLSEQDKLRPPMKSLFFAKLLPGRCHTGGFGQAFRREALNSASGFDPDRWPYVLEDHEIIHRVASRGRLAYAGDHVCFPSNRRSDRSDCSWTLGERILYKLLPAPFMDWLFYRFLASRFEQRGLANVRLRTQTWQEAE